jgi:riboflavin kinase / FMN adenylyltransferase
MNVVFGLENLKNAKPAATTVGTFDGVHLGHVKIIDSLKELSQKDNLKSTLITFDPHPRVVLQQTPPFKTKLLTKIDERLELLQNQGLDQVIIAKFSRQFSELSYKEFMKNILVEKVNTKVLVVGYDHGFGKDRSGNFDEMSKISKEFNFDVVRETAITINEQTVSSSKIRELIDNGNVKDAASMLGRKYTVNGVVIKGEGRGKKLNFPTANLQITNDYKLFPKEGVYAVDCVIHDKIYRGMSNIGIKPTFGGVQKTIEINILDFDDDIYGEKIEVQFIQRMRDEKKFKNVNELIKQLTIDRNQCIKI